VHAFNRNSSRDFGVIALGLVILTYLDALNEFGISSAVIYAADDGEVELSVAFWLSMATGILAAALMSAGAVPLAGFFAMERSVALVQGGLLFLLFILSSSLGLQWEQLTLGIALGFALQTAVSLATFTLRAGIGISSHDVLSLISNAGYDCAVLIWLGTMYARKPVHQFEHRVQSWDVDSWNRALLDLLRR